MHYGVEPHDAQSIRNKINLLLYLGPGLELPATKSCCGHPFIKRTKLDFISGVTLL